MRILDFDIHGIGDQRRDFLLELRPPEVRIFDFNLVDDIDPEVHVHGFITKNVLELFGGPGHLISPAHGQDLSEADVEEDPFKNDVERDQVAQKPLIRFGCSGDKGGITQRAGEG